MGFPGRGGGLVPGLPASLVVRRGYLDSVDRTITVRSMTDPLDVLQFVEEHNDCDLRTLEAALRNLGRLATGQNYKSIVGDERFHALLAGLAGRLDDCDVRLLSMIADASARFRTSSPELSDFAQRLAEVVVRHEDAYNPRNLATVALALSIRGVRDQTMIEFLRTEALKLIHDFEPPHCVQVLEAFRRWGIFDRQLVDIIVERMSDEIDRFTSRDVVDCLGVMSRLGLARGFLLRRLCNLVFENLRQFSPRELVQTGHALAKLRFLSQGALDDLVDALWEDVPRLKHWEVSELLFTLGMTDSRHQMDLARNLVALYMDEERKHLSKPLSSRIDFCWTLCALELVDEYPEEFKATIASIVELSPPQNRVPLMKLFDVINTVELLHKGAGIEIPQLWKAACDDADRFEMDRHENSRLHSEIVMRLDHIKGSANGVRWQLRMQRGQQCGPYRVDMLDEDTKVALDLEIISNPTSRRLKHRLLQHLGYHPLRLEYWDWRRARTEEDQNSYLEREVNQILEKAVAA